MTTHFQTSNDYYGKLNRRFDERADVLRALGFKYERLEEYDTALFVLRDRLRRKPVSVHPSFLHHADDRAWLDRLEVIKRG